MTDRLLLLKQMMSIPRQIGMAITLSALWRDAVDHSIARNALNLSQCQFEHLLAFEYCLAISDRNIRRHAGPREVATVVAEDVPDMRRFLKRAGKLFRDHPLHIPPNGFRVTTRDEEAGYSTQSGEMRITRIRNSVHFVEKSEDPIVQVADACAYGFRRFFAGEKFGPEFADAIIGDRKMLRNFASPGGCECYWPQRLERSRP